MREGFEESQIRKSLKVVSEGSGASLKKKRGKKKGSARGKGVGEIKEAAQGVVHFCARYAPIVRLAAPSAATPKTVLMEGQEQLKMESLCLSYSSTNASWERDREKKTGLIGLAKECVSSFECRCFGLVACNWGTTTAS